MSIRDVLNQKGHRVVTARTTDNALTVVRELAERRIGAVVVESEWLRPVGIFSERDFVSAVAEFGSASLAMPVGNLMSTPIVTCQTSDRVEMAMAKMTLAKIRHLPVTDGDKLVGIVSIGDLVKHRLDEKTLEANVLLDLSRLHV